MTKEQVYHKTQGWCNFEDLYEWVVQHFPSGSTFVEVGSWRGKSAIMMCMMMEKYNKVSDLICVDTWEGTPNHPKQDHIKKRMPHSLFEDFLNNITEAGCKDLIDYIKYPSLIAAEEFSDNSLDFVFIDADHSYEAVYADIEAWLPKVKPGGLLAGHDYDQISTVKRAVDELLPEAKPMSSTSWIFPKT